jgi:hypothetical protein
MKDIQHNGQKIPKGQSEAVNLRYQRGNQKPYIEKNRQHNEQKKEQTTIYKTLHITVEQEPHYKPGVLPKGKQFLLQEVTPVMIEKRTGF